MTSLSRKLESPELFLARYDLEFLKADAAGMDRSIAISRGEPGAEEWISQHQSFVLAYSGRLETARKVARYASDLALRATHREAAALYQAGAALWEGLFGNARQAERTAMAALELSNDRGVEYGAALALALSGDSSRARSLANDLAKRFPDDTSVQFSYLPALYGRLALNHGEASKAIELLERATPYELSTPRTAIHANFGALYPVYIRGEAYLAAHRGSGRSKRMSSYSHARSGCISELSVTDDRRRSSTGLAHPANRTSLKL